MYSDLILSTAVLLLSQIPICSEAPVHVISDYQVPRYLQGPGFLVAGYADRGEIYVNKSVPWEELTGTILHECAHVLEDHFSFGEWLGMRRYFGREPYYTDYAKTDYREDFAESFMLYTIGELPDGKKKQFIEFIMNRYSE